MARLRVHNYSVSLDGFGAGPDQSIDNPLGVRGEELHTWLFPAAEGLDRDHRLEGDAGIGATIMGRNMFGPIRGPWDSTADGPGWQGWWGDDPPWHHPVFVLTHHEHDPIPMAGGTTFYFVTDGIESALDQAFAAANGLDVRLGGGASTIQQYLAAGLVDELCIAITPVLLGAGERLFDGPALGLSGYACTSLQASAAVVHARITRT
jgi:dihydrofolate reductase